MLLLTGLALAAPPGDLDAAIVTDFPVLVGANAAWEHPSRLRAEATVGVLPGPYVDAINWGLTTFDVYDQTTAALIDAVLQNSLVAHGQLGYRPLQRRGLTAALGYQWIGLAGDTTDLSLYAGGVSSELLSAAQDEIGYLEADLRSHMVTAEVGYQWLVRERIVLRSAAAFGYTFRARSDVAAPWDARTPIGQAAIDELTGAAADYLVFVFEEWVHLPTVGVSAGYRF